MSERLTDEEIAEMYGTYADVDRLIDEVRERRGTCVWRESEQPDGSLAWDTSCGESYMTIDRDLSDNRACFCPYCGKRIEEGGGDE